VDSWQQDVLGLLSNFIIHVVAMRQVAYCIGLQAGAVLAATTSTRHKRAVFDLTDVDMALLPELIGTGHDEPAERFGFSRQAFAELLDNAPHDELGGLIFADADRHFLPTLPILERHAGRWPEGVQICIAGRPESTGRLMHGDQPVLARFERRSRREFATGEATPFSVLLVA
jgi:hypothetical protein